MRILKPDNQSGARNQAIVQSNQSYIENQKLGSYQQIGLDILGGGTTNTVYLKPWSTIDKETAYVVNIKNKIHEVLCNDAFGSYWKVNTSASSASTSGIDTTNKIGYRVDGSTRLDHYTLIWAFANDANTEFEGFGLSQQPIGIFSSISSGTRGSLATINNCGLANTSSAYAFAVGALVMIRNQGGTFPHEWNYGIVKAINSTSSMDVLMYPALDIQNTDVSLVTASSVIQLDKYFPWNGRTDTTDIDDRIWKPNYKLVGIIRTITDGTIFYVRKADENWVKLAYTISDTGQLAHLNLVGAGTTTINIPYARSVPIWCRSVYLNIEYNRNGNTIDLTLKPFYGASKRTEYQVNDNYSTGDQFRQIPMVLNHNMLVEAELTADGAAAAKITMVGYNDGGLKEL